MQLFRYFFIISMYVSYLYLLLHLHHKHMHTQKTQPFIYTNSYTLLFIYYLYIQLIIFLFVFLLLFLKNYFLEVWISNRCDTHAHTLTCAKTLRRLIGGTTTWALFSSPSSVLIRNDDDNEETRLWRHEGGAVKPGDKDTRRSVARSLARSCSVRLGYLP